MNLQYTSNLEKLQVFEITSADHLALIKKLRKENEHLKSVSEEFRRKSVTLEIDRDDLKNLHD